MEQKECNSCGIKVSVNETRCGCGSTSFKEMNKPKRPLDFNFLNWKEYLGEKALKRFNRLPPLDKFATFVVLLSIVSLLVVYYMKHAYNDHVDKLESYFEEGNSLLCKDKDTRDIVSLKTDWSLTSQHLTHNRLCAEYDITYCKRLDANGTIIPNHYYTEAEKTKDLEKGIEQDLFDAETDVSDEVLRQKKKVFRPDNVLHVHSYPSRFDVGEVFECDEEKVSKALGWDMVMEKNESFFRKDENSFSVIQCDSDSDSRW